MTRTVVAAILACVFSTTPCAVGIAPRTLPDETEPVFSLDRLESGRVDIGTIDGERSSRLAVQLRNSDDTPVRILAARSECAACMEIVSVHPQVVAPGETVTVRLRISPSPSMGTFNRAIWLVTDTTESEPVRVTVVAVVRQVRVLPDPLVVRLDGRGEVAATFWVLSTTRVPWLVEMDSSDLPTGLEASWTPLPADAPESVLAAPSDEVVIVGRGELRKRRGAVMPRDIDVPREIRLRLDAPAQSSRNLRLPVLIGGADAVVLTRSISLGVVSPPVEFRREVVISGRAVRPEDVVVEARSGQVTIGSPVVDTRHGLLRIAVTIQVDDAPDGLFEGTLGVTIRGGGDSIRAAVEVPIVGIVHADLASASRSGYEHAPAESDRPGRRPAPIAIGALGPAADDPDEDSDDERDEDHPGQQPLDRALFSPYGGYVPPQVIDRLARDLHLSEDQERFLRLAYDRYAQEVGPGLVRLEREWIVDLQRRMLDAFPELRPGATLDHLPEDARPAYVVAQKAYLVQPPIHGDGASPSPVAPAMSIAHTLGGEYMRIFHRAMAEASVQRIELQAALEPPRRAAMLERITEVLSDEQRACWEEEARHRFQLNVFALSETDHERRMRARMATADRAQDRPDIVGLLDAASGPGGEFEPWRAALAGPGRMPEDPLLARVRTLRVNAEAALADIARDVLTDSLAEESSRVTARTGEARNQASRAWRRWFTAVNRRREVVLQDLVAGLGSLASVHLGEAVADRWYDRVRSMRYPAIYNPDSLDIIGPVLRELTEVAVERGSLTAQALDALDQAIHELSSERDQVRRELADASWHRVFALHPGDTIRTRRAILERLSAWIESEVDRNGRLQKVVDPAIWRQAEGLLGMRRMEIRSYRSSLRMGFDLLE